MIITNNIMVKSSDFDPGFIIVLVILIPALIAF